MTCVVGVVDKKNKGVVIGADDGSVQGNLLRLRRDCKVFKLQKNMIAAFTGSFRMGQVIGLTAQENQTQASLLEEKDIKPFLLNIFIPMLVTVLEANRCIIKDSGQWKMPGELMIGIKDKLFVIGSDFQVASYQDPYTALGVGKKYALGFLRAVMGFGDLTDYFSRGGLDTIHDIVFKAIEIAGYFDQRITANSITTMATWK